MYRRQFALIKSSLSLRILIVLTLLLTPRAARCGRTVAGSR